MERFWFTLVMSATGCVGWLIGDVVLAIIKGISFADQFEARVLIALFLGICLGAYNAFRYTDGGDNAKP